MLLVNGEHAAVLVKSKNKKSRTVVYSATVKTKTNKKQTNKIR
jgi:hypothetical protein